MRILVSALPLLLLASCGTPDNVVPENAQERRLFGLLEKFDRFDYDGNGSLTKKEVRQGVKESGVHGVTEANIQHGFERCDTNRDGKISFAEAQAAMRREVGNRP
ncbi:MAG: EF-hand domain-containing protein [Verrucomicrobiales bacterium]